MITVNTADTLVKKYPLLLDTKLIDIENSCGCYLAQTVYAPRQQPPFDRVAMDGIALQFKTLDQKTKDISLCGVQRAGASAQALNDELAALEVMTGATLPLNCDTIIPYEEIVITDGLVTLINPSKVKFKQNIHFCGSDYKEGETLLETGLKINSAVIAVLASCGMRKVQVKQLPAIAIISTGDELVEPGGPTPMPWQIWRSNPFALKAELSGIAGLSNNKIDLFHLADNRQLLFEQLGKIIKNYKMIILSGGVSKGKFDFIPSVLADLGVEIIFHKIKQRPGKPMLFGKGSKGQSIFGLPGNPVSALVSLRRYVVESILNDLKTKSSVEYIELAEDITFAKDLTLFKPVHIINQIGKNASVKAVGAGGSGNFFLLATSDGFIELAQDQQIFKAGEIVAFYRWQRS